MGLETASNASELVTTNPTENDLVKSTDAHLRMIKRILKDGFQGQFTSLATIRALTAPDGSFFYYQNGMYLIIPSDLNESLPNIIKLTNGKIGLRFAIYAAGKDVLLPTSNAQKRLPLVKKVTISGTAFDTTAANNAFSGTPVPGDVVIMLGTNFSESRIFTTSWTIVDDCLYGYQSVIGSMSALAVMSPLGLFDVLRVQRLELISPQYVEVTSVVGFGPDNLRYWFGPNNGIVDFDGTIAYNSLSKTNATEWRSMTSGSINGNSTPVDGGAVVNNLNMAAAYTCQNQTYFGASSAEDARIAIGVDGTFSILALGDVTTGTPVSGAYVTTPSASTGFLYEVKFDQVSGTAVAGTLGSWLQINQTRQVSLQTNRAAAGSTTASAVITVSIRKVGDAASAKSQTVTLTSTSTVNTGPMP